MPYIGSDGFFLDIYQSIVWSDVLTFDMLRSFDWRLNINVLLWFLKCLLSFDIYIPFSSKFILRFYLFPFYLAAYVFKYIFIAYYIINLYFVLFSIMFCNIFYDECVKYYYVLSLNWSFDHFVVRIFVSFLISSYVFCIFS